MPKRFRLCAFLIVLLAGTVLPPPATAGEGGVVTIMHYFTGDLGRKGINVIFADFQKDQRTTVFDSPVGHEDFKTSIRDMARVGYLPDVFSYWAGARTRDIAETGRVADLGDFWQAHGLDSIVPASLAEGATLYDGRRRLVPFGYHGVGLFWNPEVLARVGATEIPGDWEGLLALAGKLKAKGITPFALGARHRWPAQFWFDYLLLRTAGPAYREKLMKGRAAYTDAEVRHAMALWRDLMTRNLIGGDPAGDDWSDAADRVAGGEAAMTLMGTWIVGYWSGRELLPGRDFRFAEFPEITPGVPRAMLGPVDGLLIAEDAANPDQARALVAHMLTNVEAQKTWARSQGALSPNRRVPQDVYGPVLSAVLEAVEKAETFRFNYDLATPPAVAEVGLDLFARFLRTPDEVGDLLADTQEKVTDAFGR